MRLGGLLFNMLGAMARPLLRSIAQFETEIRAERQMDGIRNAKARSVHIGRRKNLPEQDCLEVRQKRQQGVLIKNINERIQSIQS